MQRLYLKDQIFKFMNIFGSCLELTEQLHERNHTIP